MGTSTPPNQPTVDRSRLRLLGAAFAAAAASIARPSFAAVHAPVPRALKLRNTHTGESVLTPYWADGDYLPEGLANIAHVLRDHRNDTVHPIEPGLLDLLHTLHGKFGVKSGFEVISGYRSPASNAKLAAASNGVATHSLHLDGKAIDIRLPGVELKNLHRAARSLSVGGVGFYPASDFVHVDVGRVRYW